MVARTRKKDFEKIEEKPEKSACVNFSKKGSGTSDKGLKPSQTTTWQSRTTEKES